VIPTTYYLNADLICTNVHSLIGVCLTCDIARLCFVLLCYLHARLYEYISYLTPSHHDFRQERGRRWRKRSGGKVHSMRGKCCGDFEAGCPSCRQPVQKTSTGPHLFFNDQQDSWGKGRCTLYVCVRCQYPYWSEFH